MALKTLIRKLWFLIFTAFFCTNTQVIAKEPLTLGVHPYKSPQKLLKIYQPLASFIEKSIHRPVKIIIAKDYATHIEMIGNDKLDMAYLGPASYVRMVEQFGRKQILARQAINYKPTFQGKIIVSSKSGFSSITELKNKRMAYGDPNSTMSHLVPRFMLIENGITAEQLQKMDFLGSHDNVALGVLSGDYDAGAVKEAIYYKYRARGLKDLATTPALSEHLFVAGNHVPPELFESLQQILLNLKNHPEGREIMKKIKKNMTAIVPAADADYDNLRTILQILKQHQVIQ